jgi:hypothetical protein
LQYLSWPSVAAYCAFGIFVFYQQWHVKNFGGASQAVAFALTVSAFAGMVTGVAYLAYYGWAVVWWAPCVIFVLGLAASLLGFLLERIVGPYALSLVGFVGWPISAYLMFKHIPTK